MQNKKSITIKDIARLTGLSKGTVDRVLHNREGVSKKSYEKVMRAIEEAGYQPNIYASLLAQHKDIIIAVILPECVKGEFWELAEAGLVRARENVGPLGVVVRRVSYDQYDMESFRAACDEALSLGPAGVVVAPMFKAETMRFAQRLQEEGIPYVYIDSKLEEDGYLAYFGMPMYKSGYLAADMLTQGYDVDEVAIVRIRRDQQRQSDPTINRRAGFMDYMLEHYPNCQIHTIFVRPDAPEETAVAMDAFGAEHPNVRHVVMFNSRIYLTAAHLERLGVADKIRVVGFDNLASNLAALQRGTVNLLIAQHIDEQASMAIQALVDLVVFKKVPARRDNYMHMDILTRYNVEYY
ncbi:MAG: LacI family DNA-binding transcriptional regulator [Bacteroidales bacterium]|nr:LacI family DNA-binding transcriptional regulator [Bacteroidales bacterium]